MATMLSSIFLHLCLLLLMVDPTKNESPTFPEGHLKKLGSHRAPKGITLIGKFSRPSTFYDLFVEPEKPLLMRGALENAHHPGLSNWTDSYLRDYFGDEMVNVETSRKEKRGGRPTSLSLRQFLNLYLTENIYMVHSLKGRMAALALVPETFQCGGFQKVIQEAVLWMASGESASVLHYDGLDNLICVMDGRKDVVLIDKALKPLIEAVGFNKEGGYSELDVDKVDLVKYSHLQNIEWYSASVLKGDCLYIPKGWYHHVRSSGVRHLAVNLWLSHLWWFNTSDCPLLTHSHKPLKPILDIGFASPNEVYRSQLLEILHGHEFSDRDDLISAITTTTRERADQFFNAIDEQKDTLITVRELYRFNIDLAVLKFPDIFGLPHNPVPGEEKEEIILYPVKSDSNSDSESKEPTNTDSSENIDDEDDSPETRNLQGSSARLTKSDDITGADESPYEKAQVEVGDNERLSEGFLGKLDGPDSLLPDDQVVGMEETRDEVEHMEETRDEVEHMEETRDEVEHMEETRDEVEHMEETRQEVEEEGNERFQDSHGKDPNKAKSSTYQSKEEL